jgi:glycosyltransferase involved in cell wall biosynthesis
VRGWARQIERIARRERCELLIACSGDLHDLPAAAVAARRAGIPFVPYMFDDYLFQWTGFRRRIARFLEPLALRNARAVVVPNEALGEEYFRRYGIRCAVIRNPCPLPDLGALDRAGSPFPDGEAAIVYTGSVYHAHHDAFLDLAAALSRLGDPKARLHVYTSQSREDLERLGLRGPAVVHHPHIPEPEVPRVLRHARVLFLPLAFDSPIPEVIRTSAPGKMGEYMAAGRPILVHAPEDSFVSRYFRASGCGLVVGRSGPDPLAAALRTLLPGGDAGLAAGIARRARASAERDFGVGKAAAMFAALLAWSREAS